MRVLLIVAARALAVAAFAATPALSADLTYEHRNGPEVLAPYHGFAHWQLQARCSGLMKSHAQTEASKGRKTEQSLKAAEYFEAEAVKRYIADRGVDEAKARAVVAQYETSSQEQFRAMMHGNSATTGRSAANMYLSECAAFSLASSPPASTPPKILIADTADEQIVCKKVAVVGSRMPKRVCKVKSDAEEDSRESREIHRRMIELGGCRNTDTCR